MNLPKVGTRFFDKAIGNRARRLGKSEITEVEVIKSGRKYFTCREIGVKSKCGDIEYYIDRGMYRQKTDYYQDHALYKSLQEILDMDEIAEIHNHLRFNVFDAGFSRLDLAALREVKAITDRFVPPAGSP